MVRALVAVAALLAGCSSEPEDQESDSDCTYSTNAALEFESAMYADDTEFQFQLETCRVDTEACRPFCWMAVERIRMERVITRCDVTFDADKVMIDFEYSSYIESCESDENEDVIVSPPPPQ